MPAVTFTPPRGVLRVAGRLTEPARIYPTMGHVPRALLQLVFQPFVEGLPYRAQVDLGDDLADHMAAEALLPALNTGACVSVAGDALRLRHDHGQALLLVLGARDALVLQGPQPSGAGQALPPPPTRPEAAHAAAA